MADSSPIHAPSSDGEQLPIDIQAWVSEASRGIETIHITSSPSVRGTSVRLSIPLDSKRRQRARQDIDSAVSDSESEPAPAPFPRRKPIRRDSLDRREALLKGKEGSRQRRRWENDRLLNNPWAQPPLPSDWEVHPTHPKRVVPYYLAPLWDAKIAAKHEEEFRRQRAASKARHTAMGATYGARPEVAARVSKQLRESLKRSKAAKPLLKDLEEEIRSFVQIWEKKAVKPREDGLDDADSEEEEVVFAGKHGEMHDLPPSPKSRRKSSVSDVRKEKLVFDSLVDDHGANFGRWLVHSIAAYYGLRTWSVTTGDPARREAYVGITRIQPRKNSDLIGKLPRPLWGLV